MTEPKEIVLHQDEKIDEDTSTIVYCNICECDPCDCEDLYGSSSR